eukprot:Platyproteum_vivax@DN6243_c0_g2_i1.p1
MNARFILLAIFLWDSVYGAQPYEDPQDLKELKYAVVIDAGSTGTRAHVNRYQINATKCGSGWPVVYLPDEHLKVKPGLTGVDRTQEKVEDYLDPLRLFLLQTIPEEERKTTPILLRGTGGMRQLSEETAVLVMDLCSEAISKWGFLFTRKWAHVMDGETEGMYGWLAVNQLAGHFFDRDTVVLVSEAEKNEAHRRGEDASRRTYHAPTPEFAHMPNGTSAALVEMGGASSQVVFLPNGADLDGSEKLKMLHFCNRKFPLLSTTYNGFGRQSSLAHWALEAAGDNDRVENECLHKDARRKVSLSEGQKTVEVTGTAKSQKDCAAALEAAISQMSLKHAPIGTRIPASMPVVCIE